MATNEMTRVELLHEIETAEAAQADSAIAASPAIQANPYLGIAAAPFSNEAADVLLGAVSVGDIEIRPDGLIYLPEIKYRRILNRAFGPGAWSLLPMEITVSVQDNMLFYKGALFVLGRFVSEAIGEQKYDPHNDRMSYATAAESAKSNCLMRCCKDLGIASELWDPSFVRRWIADNAVRVWCMNVGSRDRAKKKQLWRKASADSIDMYPWKEESAAGGGPIDVTGTANGRPAPERQAVRGTATATESKPSKRSPSDAQLPLSPLVTPKQIGRFRAIGRSNGWTELEQNLLLEKFGFGRADEITRDVYNRICAALENPIVFTEVRAEADEALEIGAA
ncbi:MAG: hypothetical protein H7X80_01145 [bacterium]|nr:hypothetical protein [Candidatus Kapabacteria bacterium]